jgi:Na+-driven multidrug efflux pump
MLWILFAGRSRLQVTLKGFYVDLKIVWRIVKIGFPALVSMMQQNLAQLALVRLMAPFGTVALAAHGIVQRVEMMIFMPAMAVGMGSGVLVGQNLGAKQPERAQTTAWRTLVLLEGLVVVCSLALLLWPGTVIRIFSSELEMVSTAGTYLRIAVAGFVATGFLAVFNQSLNGAGDTTPTMIISVAAIWLISMPLAFFLPQLTNLGSYGVRWGIACGMIFNGLVHTIYFMFGRWKRKKV